jgi:hypothetical protein
VELGRATIEGWAGRGRTGVGKVGRERVEGAADLALGAVGSAGSLDSLWSGFRFRLSRR